MCEHVTVSGIMAFDPNLFEDGMNVDIETHHMVGQLRDLCRKVSRTAQSDAGCGAKR